VDRAAVLAFAVLESFENEDGDGDMWIKSVQLARAAGGLDRTSRAESSTGSPTR